MKIILAIVIILFVISLYTVILVYILSSILFPYISNLQVKIDETARLKAQELFFIAQSKEENTTPLGPIAPKDMTKEEYDEALVNGFRNM